MRLTRLRDEVARVDANWFAVRTGEGETIPVASAETLEMGPPLDLAGNASATFALVFDVPPRSGRRDAGNHPWRPAYRRDPVEPGDRASPDGNPLADANRNPAANRDRGADVDGHTTTYRHINPEADGDGHARANGDYRPNRHAVADTEADGGADRLQ